MFHGKPCSWGKPSTLVCPRLCLRQSVYKFGCKCLYYRVFDDFGKSHYVLAFKCGKHRERIPHWVRDLLLVLLLAFVVAFLLSLLINVSRV